ncbi:LTA synthase family protein [uncultured Microbulbifer sp.]|uniref:LTA synthase family protein n=1 Tax=uncultured Microbulbifer sp. TaxID=348147 RepID=UPI0026069B20|nr:LTA synthase family protein [uncultured Microbulbifer sp.]
MFHEKQAGLKLVISFLIIVMAGFMGHLGGPQPVFVGVEGSLGLAFLTLSFLLLSLFLPSRLAYLVVSLYFTLFLLLVFSNWWHYQFFQSYFNYEYLAFARDGLRAFESLSQYAYWPQFSVQAVITVLVVLLYARLRAFTIFPSRVLLQSSTCLLLSIVFVSLSIFQLERLRQANALALSPYYFHPVQAFFYPMAVPDIETKEDWQQFKSRNHVENPNKFLSGQLAGNKYNVIVVTLESFRASFIGVYGGQGSLTPHFDEMATKGVLFESFYASSNYTVKSENAILCGFFDHNAKLSIAELEGEKNLNCLPKFLDESDYKTYYMHANRGKFYNRENYLPQLGFHDIYFHADRVLNEIDNRNYIGWGLSDADFYELALQRLQADSEQPFFAHLMTLSAHYPFQYDWPLTVPNELTNSMSKSEKVYAGYENAIYYSDDALGHFWNQFIHSPLAKNTILIVTGDHGVWSFISELDHVRQNEQYFRVPLFIYHPELKGGQRISQVGSHVDIPPTLLSLLDIQYDSGTFVGKNLFDQVVEPWAVMMKGGEVIVRLGEQICLSPTPMCGGGAYQSCWADTDISEFVKNFGRGDCYRIQGDLLKGGTEVKIYDNSRLMKSAVRMITYENNRVLDRSSVITKKYNE